ncbi:helix-turn-helix transcriptional regulator [Halalkalibacter sp. APA_J-10(15)]|uniref:helix-turn-helix transcriptional regulator n=1 Tax=Halalkalibacter sp. APA_J-10(15) TaxID=2933805 RepID=UPI001FF57014|nr:helix-turn-helix transcriptional regulator [Halalkalibacter sp. APA_J-10(15)]MCK0471432.1 helix-turn-helix domain-containing protein [Halalkalibacter sp. APA_J-10(15)]
MKLEKLRETRKSQGKTQTFMAKKLGYKSVSGYANIEMGRNKPTLKKAKEISEILGVDVNDLFFEKELLKMSKIIEL